MKEMEKQVNSKNRSVFFLEREAKGLSGPRERELEGGDSREKEAVGRSEARWRSPGRGKVEGAVSPSRAPASPAGKCPGQPDSTASEKTEEISERGAPRDHEGNS